MTASLGHVLLSSWPREQGLFKSYLAGSLASDWQTDTRGRVLAHGYPLSSWKSKPSHDGFLSG